MPDDGRALPDMLAMVPRLLQMCAPFWCERIIRGLRLVSRDLSVTMMRVVIACSVQLGEGACPAPRQLVKMMQPSRLKCLTVTIITTSGRPGPTLAQQLATCTSQVTELVQGMTKAIQSVTRLDLIFQHRQIRSSRSSAKASSISSNLQGAQPASSCPVSFAVITRTVCTMLAEALPGLHSLTLQGCCRDPAFAAFGASCVRLDNLTVEALSLPVKALEGITSKLPKLTSFTLTSPSLCSGGPPLTEYLEASFKALQPSTLLASLALSLDKGLSLECEPKTWDVFPSSLQQFTCRCKLGGIHNASGLLSNLRVLQLRNTPSLEQVAQILKLAPHLCELSTRENPGCVVWCEREDTISNISLLRERVLTGLQLDVPVIHLVGPNADVAAVLAAMPALPYVTSSCVLQFAGDPQPNSLAGLTRVFPQLWELTLLTDSPLVDTPVVGAGLLEALAACTSLRTLWIRIQMSHTAADLVRMCHAMPHLRVLRVVSHAGVNLVELTSALAAQGRVLDVQEVLL